MRELPPDLFDGWVAWKSLCLTDDWLQTGILAAVLHNEIDQLREIVVTALGGKYKSRIMQPQDFIPGRKSHSKSPGTLRGLAMASALKSMCR